VVGAGVSPRHAVVRRIKVNAMENLSGFIPAPVLEVLQDYRGRNRLLHPSREGSSPIPLKTVQMGIS
jgi:hypothetical protein